MIYTKKLALISVTLLTVFSCQKEVNSNSTDNLSTKKQATIPSGVEKSGNLVWAIGYDGRVYRWNGSSWDEPNSAARLARVSVTQDNSGSVWGGGSDNRVYKWNGSSWDEPNSAIRMSKITASSANVAYAVGTDLNIYKTTNGGVSWTALSKTGLPVTSNGIQGLISISCVINTNVMGVAYDNKAYIYAPTTGTWSALASSQPNIIQISEGINTAWGIGAPGLVSQRVYKWTNGIPAGWSEPNTAARMVFISTSLDGDVWALGSDQRIYKWNGSSWDEPNSVARMVFISSGNN